MSNLLTITAKDFDPNIPAINENECGIRKAGRAILFDEQGKVYLMNVTKHGYHKLPGGCVDEGEEISRR